MPKLIILADDFTGALDTAAKLAARRISCFVTSERGIDPSELPDDCEVLTIDTETRHVSPEQAYTLYRDLCRKWGELSPYLYIKTDSVMRGNLSASLAGAAEGLGCAAAFVPAFPSAGRTTKNGKHYVSGIPLEQSPFADDPLNPAVTSDVSAILTRDYPLSVQLIPEGGDIPDRGRRGEVLLFDCASDGEIARIGNRLKAAGLLRLTAGCAGFAAVLPELISFRLSQGWGGGPGGMLLLSGSANEITWKQLDYGENRGWQILSPRWEDVAAGNPDPVLEELESAFHAGKERAALAISRSREQVEEWKKFAAACGMDGRALHNTIQRYTQRLVPAALERTGVRNLAVFGGDTLYSALEALGSRSLRVQGEVEEGMPFSLVKLGDKEYTVISKSGGLGSLEVLENLRRFFWAENNNPRPLTRDQKKGFDSMLAVTMGDGNGVGPEIILKAFSEHQLDGSYVVIGDVSCLKRCSEMLGFSVPLHTVQGVEDVRDGVLNVWDREMLTEAEVQPGVLSKKAGAAARAYVEFAAQQCLKGTFDAMVTLPVNKEAVRLSDPGFTGHTELIAQVCGQSDYTMMLSSDKLTVTHVSTHVSMLQAVTNVKKERIVKVAELTHCALLGRSAQPKIAVAGLNAHAGEGGAFGDEEIREIIPAVEECQKMGLKVTGPYPPDTIFLRASKGEFDAVVCMYHDQGHIPMKVLDFSGGVNVTLGLKVMRTSVDHGTAFDIAYKGIADSRSFVEAYRFAQQMVNGARR